MQSSDGMCLYQVMLPEFESCGDCPMGERVPPFGDAGDRPTVRCVACPSPIMYAYGEWVPRMREEWELHIPDGICVGYVAKFERPCWCPLRKVDES